MGLLVVCSAARVRPEDVSWSSHQGLVNRSSGACFPICKLSNKLSTDGRADAASHQLARQVHQGHILTLWDTTSWCSRRESNPEPWD
jgi:hypothetical protein